MFRLKTISFTVYLIYLKTGFTDRLIKLTLPTPCIFESCIKITINLNFYFHTSLWCLKRFYAGLKGLHNTF